MNDKIPATTTEALKILQGRYPRLLAEIEPWTIYEAEPGDSPPFYWYTTLENILYSPAFAPVPRYELEPNDEVHQYLDKMSPIRIEGQPNPNQLEVLLKALDQLEAAFPHVVLFVMKPYHYHVDIRTLRPAYRALVDYHLHGSDQLHHLPTDDKRELFSIAPPNLREWMLDHL